MYVLVEDWICDTPSRFTPAIASIPDRTDEVLYKLRAIVSVRSEGRIRGYVSQPTSQGTRHA